MLTLPRCPAPQVAASTTLVARRGHWMAPQKVLGESSYRHAWSGAAELVYVLVGVQSLSLAARGCCSPHAVHAATCPLPCSTIIVLCRLPAAGVCNLHPLELGAAGKTREGKRMGRSGAIPPAA